MKNLKYAIGIDMSKNDFKTCFSVINQSQKVTVKSTGTFPNTQKGYFDFSKWYSKHNKEGLPLFFLLEATGVYHEHLAWFLHNQGLNVSIILANKAKRYLQSLGIKSKNDKIDAKGLAQMCAEKSLLLWTPISKQIYQLRGLTRLHEDLQNQRRSLKNQLHALGFGMHQLKEVEMSLKKLLNAIEKELAKVEEKIKKLIENDENLKSKYENISLIKGISLISFSVIVAETNGFELFKNKSQLVSYAGYDVVENQSGSKTGKTRMSKKGNSHIRRVLHMPAFNVVKYEASFKVFHERIYQKTHFKMKAYVAVQKKLLCLIYSLWKSDQAFDPNFKNEYSKAEAVDSLSVDCKAIIKKPSTRALASLDERSSAYTVSPLSVTQI